MVECAVNFPGAHQNMESAENIQKHSLNAVPAALEPEMGPENSGEIPGNLGDELQCPSNVVMSSKFC